MTHTPDERGDEELVKYMVDRFLGWSLPEDFHPDCGISFQREYNIEYNAKRGLPPSIYEPIGTNLFTAEQAEKMVRYMLDGFKSRPAPERVITKEDQKWIDETVDNHKYIRAEVTRDRVKLLMMAALSRGLSKAPAPKETNSPDSKHSEPEANYLAERGEGDVKELLWEVFKEFPIGSDRQLMFNGLVEMIEDVLATKNTHCEARIREAVEAIENMSEFNAKLAIEPSRDFLNGALAMKTLILKNLQ